MPRRGGVIANAGGGEEGGARTEWSPDARYVAGAEVRGKRDVLWVADPAAGRIVLRKRLPHGDDETLQWVGRRRLRVTVSDEKRKRTWVVTVPE